MQLGLFIFSEMVAPAKDYNYLGELLNMSLSLIFILALAFVTLLFLKKIMRSKMKTLNRGTAIKVLERRALHAKASIYVVDVLGKGIVIAESAAGGIQLLTEFPPGTDVELLLETEVEEKKESAPEVHFGKILKALFNRQPKNS